MPPVFLHDWIERLQEAGVIPRESRRIIIDIHRDAIAKVYYECNGDERMVDRDLMDAVQNSKPIGIAEAPAEDRS